ncbi:MAG: protein translocase subunit SecD [Gammaproteobacteria bacterium]
MINQYPLWKYLLILAVLITGVIYALPNLYGEDPAVQVSSTRSTVDDATARAVEDALRQANLAHRPVEISEGRLLVRFADTESQLKAADILTDALGSGHVVALNLAPATPQWLQKLNALPMYLGLDLRGGVHFLMEVDIDAAVRQAEERYVGELRTLLRDKKVRYVTIGREKAGIELRFRDAAEREKARQLIRDQVQGLVVSERDAGGEYFLRAVLSEQETLSIRRFAVQQNVTTLRNRVNELGVAEPVIQQQGENRVVVELPGVQDTARAKEILGATATLEFRLVDEGHDAAEAAATGRVPVGTRLYQTREGRPVLLQNRVMLTGDYITDASSGLDQQTGGPAVFITLDGKGAGLFSDATKDNVGRLMAVVFIESKTETRTVNGEQVKHRSTVEEVINVARIQERLSKRFQITGLDSSQEARNLALLLRAGALAAPLEIIEERTIGPSLGRENIEQGKQATIIGLILIAIFMTIYYSVFGLIANIALLFNMVLLVAVMSMLQATLTLPGIAGIALSLGMAVDANVLIYERIREELRNGNTPQAAIHAGFDRAFTAIADSNLTTLVAALVLFMFGTGPVKGFAVTLSIGIMTTLFTAILGTRAMVNLLFGGRRLKRLPIGI